MKIFFCNKKAGLLALLFSMFLSKILMGQNIIDRTIETGNLAQTTIWDMGSYGDSLIVVGFSERVTSGRLQLKVRFYNVLDLSIEKTLIVDSSISNFGLLSLSDISRGCLFHSESAGDSSTLHLYILNSDLSITPKFQVKRFEEGYYANMGILDSEIYAMLIDESQITDTTKIEVYDMNGNLNRDLKHWLPSSSQNQDSVLNPNYSLGPYKHPTNPDKIVYGNGFECRVAILDKNTLALEYVMPREPIQLYYSVTYIYGYQLYDDKIVAGGTCRYSPDPPNINWEFQSYYQARSWNGDSLERRSLGNLSVAERSYAFDAEPNTGTTILGAAAPFFNFIIEGAEYRQIKIHRFNQFGHDSIMIYGDKNHVPFSIKHTSNGDLFVLSTYTDAWTTDSTYLVLTKIPGFAISLIDEGKVSPRVQFYPNPTQDYLKVDGLMGDPAKVEVYDQQGKLHLTAEVEGKEISLVGLKYGLYIVVVTGKDGDSYSAIVKKE